MERERVNRVKTEKIKIERYLGTSFDVFIFLQGLKVLPKYVLTMLILNY